jgi:hypothetical protein
MAETYSNSLKLTNIGDGDLAGTWGQTTNTNICTLLEQAITGVIGITMTDANYTLSNINGTSDEARNAVIVVGGTNTAIRTVYTPYNSGSSKLYTFFNNTTGGYAIQVQAINSGTPTGNYVTIPNGVTAAVYFDGTNFYSGTTGSAGNFTVNGTLTASGIADLGTLSVSGTATAPTPSAGDSSTKIATTAFVSAALAAAYPVGSIYMATVTTNPATLLGFGTWVRYGQGRMPISADDSTYTIGGTGGSATTTLSTSNLPSHNHSATSVVTDPGHVHTYNYGSTNASNVSLNDIPFWYGRSVTQVNSAVTGITVGTTIGNTGSGTAATTISPYIVVYMWNRTV